MLHTFTVPVKPHVQKYLLRHLGAGYKLSQLDPYGRCLRLLLQLRPEKKAWDGFTGRYTASFGVSVEGNLLLQKRLKAPTSKTIIDFSNFVEGIIKAEFYGLVAHRKTFGLSLYGAVQQFRATYDFQDEDISHDTLKKAWQRYAADQLLVVSGQNPVSVCPLPSRLLAA